MLSARVILYGIFYTILTIGLIYLWRNEKKLSGQGKELCVRLSDKISKRFGWQGSTMGKLTFSFLYILEVGITALLIVFFIQKFYLGNFVVPTGSMIPTIQVKDRIFADMVSYKFTEPDVGDIIIFKEPINNKVLYTKRLMAGPGEEIKIEAGHLYSNGVKVSEWEYSDGGSSPAAIGRDTWVVPKKGDQLEIVPSENFMGIVPQIDIAELQKDLEGENALYAFSSQLDFYVNGVKTGPILDFIHKDKVIETLSKGKSYKTELSNDYYFVLGDNTSGSFDSRMWGFVERDRIKGKGLVVFFPLNRMGLLK